MRDLPALGHDLTHYAAKEPTANEIGWNEYDACKRCDYSTYEELAMLGEIVTIPVLGIEMNLSDKEQMFYLFVWVALILLVLALVVLFFIVVRSVKIGTKKVTFTGDSIVYESGVFKKEQKVEEFLGVYEVACSTGKPHTVGDVTAKRPSGKHGNKLLFEGVCDAKELANYLKSRVLDHNTYAKASAAAEMQQNMLKSLRFSQPASNADEDVEL